jgi:hypothetical protein
MIVSRTQMPWLTGLHGLGSTSRSIAQETLASPDDDVILSDIGLLPFVLSAHESETRGAGKSQGM